MSSRVSFESVHGYKVIEAVCFDNERGFALAENPAAVQPFVTWQFTDEGSAKDMYCGHYTDRRESAVMDYAKRVGEYKENHPKLAEKYNYLAAAELGGEQNYNQIDGIINNEPKPSIADQLREFQQKSAETAVGDKPKKSAEREI